MRHQTLYESNVDLFESLIANSDKVSENTGHLYKITSAYIELICLLKLKSLRNEYERIIIEHNSNKMSVNCKLGELSKIKEELYLKNNRIEESLTHDADRKREKVSVRNEHCSSRVLLCLYNSKVIDLSRIFWSIDNLVEKCCSNKKNFDIKQLESMTFYEKLDQIQVISYYF